MFTDTHNHTSHFSSDARMTAKELIDACKKLQMNGVSVTKVITRTISVKYRYSTSRSTSRRLNPGANMRMVFRSTAVSNLVIRSICADFTMI